MEDLGPLGKDQGVWVRSRTEPELRTLRVRAGVTAVMEEGPQKGPGDLRFQPPSSTPAFVWLSQKPPWRPVGQVRGMEAGRRPSPASTLPAPPDWLLLCLSSLFLPNSCSFLPSIHPPIWLGCPFPLATAVPEG